MPQLPGFHQELTGQVSESGGFNGLPNSERVISLSPVSGSGRGARAVSPVWWPTSQVSARRIRRPVSKAAAVPLRPGQDSRAALVAGTIRGQESWSGGVTE
jgi:hypothetical protein